MENTALTSAHQDYLKAIYHLQRESADASNSALASTLGVAPASATNMVRRLADAGLVEHTRYQGVRLTAVGEQAALETIRHHRLIELFLHDILDLPWDQVHKEAERLEHAISEEVEEAIARKLGYPTFDPHGDPIPAKDGSRVEVSSMALAGQAPGTVARLQRVRTQDGDRLRYLGSLGLYPGACVTVVARSPFDGPLTLEIDGRREVLAHDLAQLLFITLEDPQAAGQPG
jgi:DtxR family Mn-dependent transcriptional regulator